MYRDIIPFHEYHSPTSGNKLNLGCGRRFHKDWINVDLRAQAESIIECDITKGLPFPDGSFQAVYHSHLLEHLDPEQGRRLIEECHRVLEPGGVMRIVIPDLERIAKLYTQMHDRAWEGDEEAKTNYAWIKLELLDQMVRHTSGGQMGRYMAELDTQKEPFVRSRIGAELDLCRTTVQSDATSRPTRKVTDQPQRTWRERIARRMIKWLLGNEGARMFDETRFRQNGEIHRWMYDRFSLRDLCEQIGLSEFRCCAAEESDIEGFNHFHLDTDGARVFKPDSLFVECRKPRAGRPSVPIGISPEIRRAA